jgi:hypothetical protein
MTMTMTMTMTIMTPHLQVEHPSLNPLSFHLTFCLTQLHAVCSVGSAVLINTSFCCFNNVWYCRLNCFLCGMLQDLPSSGSSATGTAIVCCTSELSCTEMHVYRAADGLTSWQAAFSADCEVSTGHGLGGLWGIPGQNQLWCLPARCEHNIIHSAVHTALVQMICWPRHEAESYLPGVPRLERSGAVPLLFLSAFMMWWGANLVYPYLITLSVASMALNDGVIGKW